MPLLLDDDPKGGPLGFDLATATTLFWKPVPVFVKQQDREDQQENLTFRILSGCARQNHSLRVRAVRPRLAPLRRISNLHSRPWRRAVGRAWR